MSSRHPWGIGAYALAGVLAIFELAVLWQALHPQVPDHYRAYYLDRTTTCLPQPVSGDYELGKLLDFRSGGDETRENRPCGWEGPVGDGMHSIGESSRLRFAVERPQELTLSIEITGVTLEGPPRQRVLLSAGGQPVGEAAVGPGETRRFEFAVPAAAVKERFVDILLDYPDAISPRQGVANNYWRSIKLLSAQLSARPAD